jgi:hypothetical protein
MFELNPDFPNATNQQKWDQFRLWRMSELACTDWSVSPDSPLSTEEMKQYIEYRTFLRDAPQKYETVEDIKFPYLLEIRDYKMVLAKSKKAKR